MRSYGVRQSERRLGERPGRFGARSWRAGRRWHLVLVVSLTVVRAAPVPGWWREHRRLVGLAVLTREVGDAAGGWLAFQRGVSAVVIVGVQPAGKGVAPFLL